MKIEKSHPYWFVRDLIEREPAVSSVHLSYYKYRPQSLIDERQNFVADRSFILDTNAVERFIEKCPKDREVSISSLIKIDSEINFHLPMIDMSTSSRAHLTKLLEYLGENLFYSFAWFESGRSFHGYGSKLISQSEWNSFMGTLLLSNKRDLKPTVDPRWIGHRLIAGYAALRWSKNTSHYLGMPTRII